MSQPPVETFSIDALRVAGIIPADFLENDVFDIEGARLGKIVDLIIDPSSTYILAFEIQLASKAARTLGLKRVLGSSRVSFRVSLVKGIGDVVTLKFSVAELRELVKGGLPELRNAQRLSEGRV